MLDAEEYMKLSYKVYTVMFIALLVFIGCGGVQKNGEKKSSGKTVEISLYYSDNATLPFKADWLTIKESEKRTNTKLNFEPIPIADYGTKVSLALNTGNTPDVILYRTTQGENASLAMNGALVALSDYRDWTPNFNKQVEKFGMEKDVDSIRLKDGKYYYLPSLFDTPFYDGGLILREDILKKYNLSEPKTFDDLYVYLKKYKQDNPDSYPLTILAGPRVLFRMTMPSYGISLGKNSSTGTGVLSWNYDSRDYFAGATSDMYKSYVSYLAKLYKEGLLDPEMADPIDGDKWAQKLATGKAVATYAYYDQIGGVTGKSSIQGFKLQMYPPLEGPGGAHHQPKSRTQAGIMIPAKTAKRADFEAVVRAVDDIFFSDEGAKLWCLGVEGVTYTEKDGKITYAKDIVEAPEGVYKSMQIKYGCGSDVTQLVWINSREMTKYDENYARINAEVEKMDNAIQAIPPTPLFDDVVSEEAGILRTPLLDAFEKWTNDFITGQKDIEKSWATYMKDMNNLGIEKYLELYNSHRRK